MPDEILTDIPREGANPEPEAETNTQPDSSPETTQAEDTHPAGGDNNQPEDKTPFDEHPRWRQLLEKDKQRDAELAELRAFREQAEPIVKKFAPVEQMNIPSWFGGDETSWKAFQADQNKLISQAEENAVKRIKADAEAETKRIQEANDWLEQSIQEIEKAGLSVDRNKLLKKTMDEQLVDSSGRWNYKAAAKLLAAEELGAGNTNLEARKKIIASTTDSKAEPTPRAYKTQNDFKGNKRPW